MTDNGFTVLFVCHANLCRSPMAERLGRRTFAERLGADASRVRVVSAGTHASAGEPMHPVAAQVLDELGIDTADFTSRPLAPALVAGADLVLTAGREQRAACVSLAPEAMRRTFTLRQFGRMTAALRPDAVPQPDAAPAAGGAAEDRLGDLLDRALQVRSRLQPVGADEDDLPDPIGRPVTAFRTCAFEIQRVLDLMTGALTHP